MERSGTQERVVGAKIFWRLVLPSALFILMGSIDRANVGFAALQMNHALGFTSAQYGFGAGVLFIGYIGAKLPSVLLYERIGMHRWLALITFAWGMAAVGMAFVQTHTQFYVLRLLVGFSEGGLSSGLMLYLSHWAIERYRASILAIPIGAISVSQVIGAPLSGWLLEMSNPLGWEGWRWMFLVEGLPALLLAVFAFIHFPDRPQDARWLHPGEVDWLSSNVTGATKPKRGMPERWAVVRNPLLWACAGIWFCLLAGNYGVIFWLPLVVRSLSGFTSFEVGLVVAAPWAASAIGLLLNARHSDKSQERYLHVAVPAAIGAASLLGAFLAGPGLLGLFLLILGGGCMGSTVAPFWAIPTRVLPPEGLAIGIVVINFLGSFAGLIVPATMGMLKDGTGTFAAPTFLMVGILLGATLLCLWARRSGSAPDMAAMVRAA
jgi:ACS family tartrate transporter-like MFS transporter